MRRQGIVIVLTLVLSLIVAGAEALVATDVAGTWYLNTIEMNGASISPEVMGMEMTMTLNEDKSTVLVASGQNDTAGTWMIENDELTVDDGITAQVFALVDDTLVTEMFGMTMSFGKEKVEAPAVEIASVRIATDISEFDGTWRGVQVDYMGTIVPLALVQMDLTMTISGGEVQLNMMQGDQIITQEMTGELVEGALLAAWGEGETMNSVILELHEDGALSYSMTADETTATIYCEKMDFTP